MRRQIPRNWFGRHSRPKILRCLFLLMQGNALKARSSAVFHPSGEFFFDGQSTIEIRLCQDFSYWKGDWIREQTLIHWILSWISFSNRFKQPKLTLDFSQWASDGLYYIVFLGRSITCKLFSSFCGRLGARVMVSLMTNCWTCFDAYYRAKKGKTRYFEHLKEQ